MMADGDESPFPNYHLSNGGSSSGLDFSNASAANVSSTSFSKIWTFAQNVKSVFTRSTSQPPATDPVSTLHSRKTTKAAGSYEGYVSNDEEDYERFDNSGNVDRTRVDTARISESAADNATAMNINKRPFAVTPDESAAIYASKRPRVEEAPLVIRSERSSSSNSHRRFWTSDGSVHRPPYRPSSISATKPISLSIFDKNQLHQETSKNLFSVTPRSFSRPQSAASYSSAASSFATLSSISELNRKNAARNSETKRILLDLERVGGLPSSDSKRPRLWFQTISEEGTPFPRLSAKKQRTPFGPPTSSLRTTDRAQVLPTVITPLSGLSSQRPARNETTPPIPAAVKRLASGESNGQHSAADESTVFGKAALPSACKFTFSKPVPVACAPGSEKAGNASFPDISSSKLVPFPSAQTTAPVSGGSLQFPKIVSTPSPAATSTTDSLSRPQSVAEVTDSDKSTFEGYKKAPKWKCFSCHFNNNSEDTSCRQCFREKGSVDNGPKEATEKWRCVKCGLDNIGTSDRCKSCQNSKNQTNAASSAADAKWSCSTCFVANSSTATSCACCSTPRPVKQAVSASTKPKWSCSACFIANDDTASKCVCCLAPKPKVENKPGESWWCKTCMIKNDPAASNCMACGTERVPSVSQAPKEAASARLDAVATSSKAKWNCPTCFVANDSSVEECACCKTQKPGQTKPSNVSSGTSVTSIQETTKADTTEKKLANWSCTTCFLSNTGDRVKCIACQAPKPGAVFKPVRLGANLFGQAPGAAVFGQTAAAPSSSFSTQFGLSSEATVSKTATPSSGFPAKFGLSSELPSSKTGTQATPLSLPKADSAVSFGKPPQATAAVSSAAPATAITFGITSKPPSSDTVPKFGVVKPAVSDGQPPEKVGGFAFSKPTDIENKQAEKPADVAIVKPATTETQAPSLGLFGTKPPLNPSAAFTFGQKAGEASATNIGIFGKASGDATKANDQPVAPVFGQPMNKDIAFDLGKKTMSESQLSDKPVKFNIGTAPAPDTVPKSTAAPFTFGSSSTIAPMVFGQKAAESTGAGGSTFTFGNVAKTNGGAESETKTTSTAIQFPTSFNFAAAGKTNGGVSLFPISKDGQTNDIKKTMSESQLSNKIFEFGSAKTSGGDAQPTTNPISFGNTSTAAAPFTFGTAKPPEAGGFNFGALGKTNGGASTGFGLPSFSTSSSAFGLDKANGETKTAAPLAFPSLSATNLFGMDKAANGSGSSPAIPALPISSNPFSVTSGPSSTPSIAGRRQLVAKRKTAKRN